MGGGGYIVVEEILSVSVPHLPYLISRIKNFGIRYLGVRYPEKGTIGKDTSG